MTAIPVDGLLTPEQQYRVWLASGELEPDPAQAAVVAQLQDLQQRLLQPQPRERLLTRLTGLGRHPASPEKGLYIWGGVGRGKTWLVDLFYNQLPLQNKQRIHFHHFMRVIHEELSSLRGQPDPLRRVATDLAKNARVLCLDEFIVTDIGDAMILSKLFKTLFQQGVTLVTSSNTRPHDLYRDGIQRSSFLQAIELLKTHTHVMELSGGIDYRLRYLAQARVYHTPLGPGVTEALQQEFSRLAPEAGQVGGSIRIFQRDIPLLRMADDLAWFDFMALCGPPRSQNDYLELACRFHTVLISDIPLLGPALDDVARRFLYLLDEFYDRNVKLILSAAGSPESLYQGERLAFDFQRATSRLHEMQSMDYLAREHRP